jgi:hypothetical protein
MNYPDEVLSILSSNLINRRLPKIIIREKEFDKKYVDNIIKQSAKIYDWPVESIKYLVYTGSISSSAYSKLDDKIKILYKSGEIKDIVEASDVFNVSVLSQIEKKYFLCYPELVLPG